MPTETDRIVAELMTLGPLAAPSCLCCGKLPDEVAIRHMELPGVVICKTCRDAALPPDHCMDCTRPPTQRNPK